MDRLNEYDKKRDFTKTDEPKGRIKESTEKLKFVIQHHMARADHYDLRLEWNGVLLSWAVPKGPSLDTRDKRLAVQVEDHPLDYRNFEGIIPEGQYGGGAVMLWDEGFWQPLVDVDEGLKKGELKFSLEGKRIKGKFALIRWESQSHKGKNHWLLLKEKDEYVKDTNDLSEFNTSVRTGRTMLEIEQEKQVRQVKQRKPSENPFKKASVQLASLVDEIPEGKDWVYEVKYDGYRILAFIENKDIRLLTRNNMDYHDKFPSIGASLLDFAEERSMVLDGEIVVLDQAGITNFQALQNYLNDSKKQKITYIVFDILSLDGKDLREKPLSERKNILESLMKNAPDDIMFSSYINGEEENVFKAACQAGLEGIVGKNINSSYGGNRDGSWIKMKCVKKQEFVIGGYTLTDKKTNGISALLLGVYENNTLVYVGRAGTGMSKKDMDLLGNKFESLITQKPPFKKAPKERSNEKITWLKPELVAEIQFAEWTEDHKLRHPSFKGLRMDKDVEEVIEETVNKKSQPIIIDGLEITHPDKILYEDPEITKLDVIRYYQEVSERMLPYVGNRILSVVRCPRGISEGCFFMKHPPTENQNIISISIEENDGEKDAYFYINSESGIIYEVQMGTLEFHTWGSTIKELEKPDMMVFDLDPDLGMDLSAVRQGVRDIKGILDELSLTSYLKTSGGKGYHVVVPIKPNVTWDTFHDFARNIAEVMEKKWPDRYTNNIRKEKRKNKIFIDWIRNGRGATSVAPYSIRARKGAKVSMPIGWDELDSVEPDGINMEQAIARIKSDDPWKGFFANDQTLG